MYSVMERSNVHGTVRLQSTCTFYGGTRAVLCSTVQQCDVIYYTLNCAATKKRCTSTVQQIYDTVQLYLELCGN